MSDTCVHQSAFDNWYYSTKKENNYESGGRCLKKEREKREKDRERERERELSDGWFPK
jgi:hypothetical protein